MEQAIRDNTFFEVLHDEIDEGRQYYDSRVPLRVRRDTEIFTETLQQFVQMKREELQKVRRARDLTAGDRRSASRPADARPI